MSGLKDRNYQCFKDAFIDQRRRTVFNLGYLSELTTIATTARASPTGDCPEDLSANGWLNPGLVRRHGHRNDNL